MYGIGWPELIIIFIMIAVIIVPVIFMGKILSKAGFSSWFALISFVPLVNIIALWIFAFIPWPKVDRNL